VKYGNVMEEVNIGFDVVRRKTAECLSSLERELDREASDRRPDSIIYDSWIRGTCIYGNGSQLPTKRCRYFDRFGFIIVPSFSNVSSEVSAMKDQMEELVNIHWHPNSIDKMTAVFRTDEKQLNAIDESEDYFLTSANSVHFFAEKDVLDENCVLKPEFLNNKVGPIIY